VSQSEHKELLFVLDSNLETSKLLNNKQVVMTAVTPSTVQKVDVSHSGLQEQIPKILILTTLHSSDPGANAVGQARLQYDPNTYILRVPDPVMFPESFYLRTFEQGIAAIIIMSSGSDCPYEGAYERLSKRIDRVYSLMKERGIPTSRLKLTTICTVCRAAFLKEISEMRKTITEHSTPKVA
jgi:coenzyme F420-reducing hydrogenase delta subunit